MAKAATGPTTGPTTYFEGEGSDTAISKEMEAAIGAGRGEG